MTGPRRPQTCSHPIRTLTGVCQAVRMFSPCQFHVYASKELCMIAILNACWNQS